MKNTWKQTQIRAPSAAAQHPRHQLQDLLGSHPSLVSPGPPAHPSVLASQHSLHVAIYCLPPKSRACALGFFRSLCSLILVFLEWPYLFLKVPLDSNHAGGTVLTFWGRSAVLLRARAQHPPRGRRAAVTAGGSAVRESGGARANTAQRFPSSPARLRAAQCTPHTLTHEIITPLKLIQVCLL